MNQNLQTKLDQARAADRPQGRARFLPANVPVVDNGPEGSRPLYEPTPGEVARLREGIASHVSAQPLDRSTRGVLDVARRLRREHLSGDNVGYALVSAADLDLILAFVEERA